MTRKQYTAGSTVIQKLVSVNVYGVFMAQRESTKVVAVRVPESMVIVLEKEARRRRIRMSDYLRRVLGAEVESLESRKSQSIDDGGLGMKQATKGSDVTSVKESVTIEAVPKPEGNGAVPSGYLDTDRPPSSVQSFPKVGRNAKCPGGSNRKYKVCHGRLS